jgi:inhibitor of KinA
MQIMQDFTIQPLGDTGLHVDFGQEISYDLNRRIRFLYKVIEAEKISGIRELVPAYTTLSIYYQPEILSYEQLKAKVLTILNQRVVGNKIEAKIVEIPTFYGGRTGEDLSRVAALHGLHVDEVVKMHSGTDYLVYMMGFLPGFPYLGGLFPELCTPRLEDPRSHVAEGSVGIAGNQTGVYSLESPGGWNIIGRTPVKLFDPAKEVPFLLEPGDYIRFIPIDEIEYKRIEERVKSNTYQVLKKDYLSIE